MSWLTTGPRLILLIVVPSIKIVLLKHSHDLVSSYFLSLYNYEVVHGGTAMSE